jgi:hypothetical protein
MEPSRRNQWESAADRLAAEAAEATEIRLPWFASGRRSERIVKKVVAR